MNEIKDVSLAVCQLKSLYTQWAKEHSINYNKLLVLYVVYETRLCTQKQIIDKYGIPKQTVSNIISGLLKDGYVDVTKSRKYHREKLIELTDEGVKYAEGILLPFIRLEERIGAQMGVDAVDTLARLLLTYIDTFTKEI